MLSLKTRCLPHAQDLPLPAYHSPEAAGMDLYAAIAEESPYFLMPGYWQAIPTGLIFEIPKGYEGQIRPRSGLALRHGITVLNAPGTIDSDYRGEIQIILINQGRHHFEIKRGMRIAQIVIAPVTQVTLSLQESLSSSQRGENGFGSTGG